MKCIINLTLVVLVISFVALTIQDTHDLASVNATLGFIPSKFSTNDVSPGSAKDTPPTNSPPSSRPPSKPSWEDEIWQKAHCRGAKLLAAMSASDDKQRNILQWPYIQSTWDGNLHLELEEWGYRDSDELHRNADVFCDFGGSFHELRTGFKAMGIDPRSANLGAQITASTSSIRMGRR
jgi:hypothetical protein